MVSWREIDSLVQFAFEQGEIGRTFPAHPLAQEFEEADASSKVWMEICFFQFVSVRRIYVEGVVPAASDIFILMGVGVGDPHITAEGPA